VKIHPHDLRGEAWPFAESENATTFVCVCVHRRQKPLLRVLHDDDGDWQFLCGDDSSGCLCGKRIGDGRVGVVSDADVGE
jgi:hypothetical protein